MLTHFKRLCLVVDELPLNLDFKVLQQLELQFLKGSGLLQELKSHYLLECNADSVSLLKEYNN